MDLDSALGTDGSPLEDPHHVAAHHASYEPAGTGERTDLNLDLDGDTLREECGVFGIFNHPDAAAITAIGIWYT